mmetsp:Transcript_93214/g.263847  ORF Transcript_93214/g.263847 Transcript_93214/m.263847 type:complete len:259 (+) Transcript_93214:45-821(+)
MSELGLYSAEHVPPASSHAGRAWESVRSANINKRTVLAAVLTLALLGQPFAIWHSVASAAARARGRGQARTGHGLPDHAGPREWEVVAPKGACVQRYRTTDSDILRSYPTGTVLVGRQLGEWMKLFNETGYARISLALPGQSGSVTVLSPRDPQYVPYAKGDCGRIHMTPIMDKTVCLTATLKLGLNATVELKDAPLWCSFREEAPSGTWTGANASRGWGSLCSNYDYPGARSTAARVATNKSGPDSRPPRRFFGRRK